MRVHFQLKGLGSCMRRWALPAVPFLLPTALSLTMVACNSYLVAIVALTVSDDGGGGGGSDGTGGASHPSAQGKPTGDIALAGGDLLVVLDAIGRDPTVSSLIPGGAPLQTLFAPSGGNIIDLELRDRPNDQVGLSALAVRGIVNLGDPRDPADDIRNNPLHFLVFNFETRPESPPSGGERLQTFTVQGVILNTSGSPDVCFGPVTDPPVSFFGTATMTLAQVRASAAAAEVPRRVFDNVPDAARIIVNSLGIPLLVSTSYLFHRSPSRMVTTSSWVHNPANHAGAIPQPVFIDGLVQLFLTGLHSRNLDVLVPAPAFTGGKISVPTAIAPFLTLVGRDEPGVSYTIFDPMAGQVVVERFGAVGVGAGRIPRTRPADGTTIPITSATVAGEGGPLGWIRHIALGERNDAESSAETAVRDLRRLPPRKLPGFQQDLLSGIVATSRLWGVVQGGGTGAIVQVFEVSPAFYAESSGRFVSSTSPILRTTVRPDAATGEWSARVPAGFLLPGGAEAAESTYGIRVLIPGRGPIPPEPGGFAALAVVKRPGSPGPAEPRVQVRTIDAGEGAAGILEFQVVDGEGLPLAAKLTFRGAGIPDPELGDPTGLAARVTCLGPPCNPGAQMEVDAGTALDRAAGAGNVLHSATGKGTVTLPVPAPPAPAAYRVIASHGLEYEIEEGLGAQAVSIAPGARESRVFTLRRVVNSPRRAVSGDFHVHSSASPDSSVPPADLLTGFLAAGVDLLCSTEHDNLFDLGESLGALARSVPDVKERLAVLSGAETTSHQPFGPFTEGIGHFNAFPLEVRPEERRNGSPEDELRPPWLLFAQLRGRDGTAGNEIIQLNHPRLDLDPRGRTGPIPMGGLFEILSPRNPAGGFPTEPGGLDPRSSFFCAFAAAQQLFGPISFSGGPNGLGIGTGCLGSGAIAALFNGNPLIQMGQLAGNPAMVQAGVALGGPDQSAFKAGSLGFDALEVLHGSSDAVDYLQTRGDWFNLLNHGIVRTATGNSDTHALREEGGGAVIGFPRNYLLLEGVTPAGLQAEPSLMVTALRPSFNDPDHVELVPQQGGRFVVRNSGTGGAFRGSAGRSPHGKSISTSGPFIDVRVFRRIAGVRVDEPGFTAGDFPSLLGFDDAVDVVATIAAPRWVPADEVRVVCCGTALRLPGRKAPPGGPVPPSFTIQVTLSQFPGGRDLADSWVVVEAGQTLEALIEGRVPGGLYSEVAPGRFCVGFTNAVFLDRNGNGVYDPPVNSF